MKPVRSQTALAWLTLFACAATGCVPDSTPLEGSLLDVLDLSYEQIELTLTDDFLGLRYSRGQEQNETVLQLNVITTEVALTVDEPIDLASDAPSGAPRTTVTRNVATELQRALPGVQIGNLTLFDPPESAETMRGQFSVLFDRGIEAEAGRVVRGRFKAQVIR